MLENTTTIAGNTLWSPTDAQLSDKIEISRYAPFNRLTAHNRSDKDVEVRLFGSNVTDKGVFLLPAGASKELAIDYYRPYVYNRDATLTIAVNKIVLEIEKVVV